jgi:predicted component of type VI protein secretion system
MAKLIFIDNNFIGQVYELVLEKTTVGRCAQNTLVIRDDSLSSVHCEILVNGPEVIVRDLDSGNGTFVNGVRIKNEQCQLKHGQKVRFGSVEARLELEPAFDDESISEISAIYSHRRALGALSQAPQRTQPTNASKHIEPNVQSVAEVHSVVLPAGLSPVSAPFVPDLQNLDIRAKSRSMIWLVVIAAAIMISSIVVFWLLWSGM